MSAAGSLQRRFALATVGLPTIGTGIAVAVAASRGVGRLELGLLGGMYVATALGVEAGFHRFFSHRSFRAGRATTAALGILGSMAAQGPVLFWASIHRKHHALTDQPGDPHSPAAGSGRRLRRLLHAHFLWLFEADTTDWRRYVPDLLRDRDVFLLSHRYPLWVLLGLAIPAVLGAIVSRSLEGAGLGLLWGGAVRIFLLDHVTWAVNSIGHAYGPREHASRDASRNLAWLALPSLGGSWHNNHHAFPGSARNDHRPWQIDPSGLFIEALALLGLASHVQRSQHVRRRLGIEAAHDRG